MTGCWCSVKAYLTTGLTVMALVPTRQIAVDRVQDRNPRFEPEAVLALSPLIPEFACHKPLQVGSPYLAHQSVWLSLRG